MFKNKKGMLLLLSAVVLLSFAISACGPNRDTEISMEDPNTVPADSYEINWYFTYGDPQQDTAVVEAAVNDYLKDKINATVKLNRLPASQYPEKMNAKINAGEQYDLCFTASYMIPYRTTAASGVWVELDDYLDKYMPKIKALIGDDILDNVRAVDGKIYALPNLKEMAEQRGWGFRKDLVEKYDIDMSKYVYTENGDYYKSFELIKPLLKELQQKEPDLQYPIDWDGQRTPGAFIDFDSTFAGAPVGLFEHKEDGKIINFHETEDYKNVIKIARDFFQDGLIKKDVLTATDFASRLKEGKMFAYAEFLKPGKTDEISAEYKFKLGQIGVTPITARNGNGTGSMTAISSTSKNPARTARFLELFNTDKTLNNLIIYGVEGKHYKKLPELGPDYIEIIKDGGYTLSGTQWSMGNVFLNYLTANEAPDKVKQLQEFNAVAIKPQHYGFVFDSTPIESQKAAIKTIETEYKKQTDLGSMDYEPLLATRAQRFKEAGIDKVMEEAQKQYDAFRASKQ